MVIAIILTLAGIAMTVVNGVMEKSKVTTARSDCNGLQTAVENYMLDNGRVPVAWSSREMTKQAHKDGQYYVTTAVDEDEDRKLNPKKTAYFNTTTTDVEGAPGLFFESRGRVGLMDPWESPYYIILNANPDDRTPRVQVGSRMVTKNVAVYSTGKDKQGSTADGHINNPELTEDNVTSW